MTHGLSTADQSGGDRRPLLVVMGVSGCGKSAVGAALAQRLEVPFADGDDFHSAANRANMAAGRPLDDDDRRPWLDLVGTWLQEHVDGGAVMGCSALKRIYRDQIRQHAPTAEFVYLYGSREVIARRQASRPGHFMPPSLLDSQFATLEPLGSDEAGTIIDVDQSIDSIVQFYVEGHDDHRGDG